MAKKSSASPTTASIESDATADPPAVETQQATEATRVPERVAELMRRGHGQPMAEHIHAKELAASKAADKPPSSQE